MAHEETNRAAETSPAKAVKVRAQLSATERLVEAAQELSIAIRYESKLNEGCTFMFEVPRLVGSA